MTMPFTVQEPPLGHKNGTHGITSPLPLPAAHSQRHASGSSPGNSPEGLNVQALGPQLFITPSILQRSGFKTAPEFVTAGVDATAKATRCPDLPPASPTPPGNIDADSPELDLETKAVCAGTEKLFDQYLVVAVNYDAFKRHPTTGFPLVTPREVVQKFLAIVFNSLSLAGAHAEGLPYDATQAGSLPTLACAMDLPLDAEEISHFAKDLRFNNK